MHNDFYASGFIYHPASQQILLHQHPATENEPALWHLFGGHSQKNESAIETFHRVLTDTLGLSIKKSDCFAIYDYKHKEKNIPVYIHYAVIEELPEEDFWGDDVAAKWFIFKQIAKLPTTKQTKQDVIVGQRVINLAVRELETPVEAAA